ncbi:hypothetical protein ACGFJC_47545 [Nonomuraea fuscirosea]|uniref:hypothetical protein n=1 Tax=Nonomuraea fuscirosea TaxID=1291556 RepID=UPI003711B47A
MIRQHQRQRPCNNAVAWYEDGTYECRNCGGPLAADPRTGMPFQPARHRGEPRRQLTPAPQDAAMFARAVQLGEHAANNLPDMSTRDEIVRAVVEEFYRAGMLRKVPAPPKVA